MKRCRSKPVFIVGCARSGTTWLYHLLLSSGGFAIYRSETQFYNRFGPRFGNFTNERQRNTFLDSWLKSEFFLRSGLNADSFREAVLKDVNSPGTMLNTFMNRICDEQSAKRWVECTPDHALHIRSIKRDFPDALFIHVVRDGRDVALSLAKQAFVEPFPWHTKQPQLAAAAYWAWITDAVLKQVDYLGDDLLSLHYEDLLENLDSALLRVATFIDKPIDPLRINTHSFGSVVKPNSSFDRGTTGIGDQFGPRWHNYCNVDTLSEIENVIRRRLDRFGYQQSTAPPGIIARIRSTVLRQVYFMRFRTRHILKQLTIFRRFTANELQEARLSKNSQDPTTRPQENMAIIRRLVGS